MENSIVKKMNSKVKNSAMVKLAIIGVLTLLLLIPSTMITSIIHERKELNSQVTNEVSSKWANSQQVNGPIITIPLLYESIVDDEKIEVSRYFHLLPEELNVDGDISPEKLRRGIYEAVVYKSNLSVNGFFNLSPKINTDHLKEIKYDKAFLTIGISDLRGIEDQIELKWNNQTLSVQPGSRIPELVNTGVTIELPNLEQLMEQSVDFNFVLNLQGSRNISFVPLGSTTNVSIRSNWNAPSFTGNFLPDNRELNEEGFNAHWKILQLNRNFPQSWLDNAYSQRINASAFGVNLLLPLDDYQKSIRSAKYAVMTIGLTFLIFFLVEILNNRKFHPLQYALVGLALCLFYILLVSISEHLDFNAAYIISSISIISMIGLYAASIFKVKKLTMMLILTLAAIYSFLFVTLQMADYALLMGSIGLAIILGLTMYFTRNVDWYGLSMEPE